MKSRRIGHPRLGVPAGCQGVAALALVVCVLLFAGCGPTSPHWQALNTSQDNTITSLAQDPTQPKIMYAGASHGIVYRSRTDVDGTPLGGSGIPASDQVDAVLPDPHTAGLVYAATTDGFYVTTDFGDHWNKRGTGFPADTTLTSLIFASDSGLLFVGALQHGVYSSADRGQTWHQISTGLPPAADVYTLFHDPTTQTLFAGLDGGGLYASADNGQTWAQRTSGISTKAHVYVLVATSGKGNTPSSPALYAGTDSGLYTSADGGQTWVPQRAGTGLPSGSVQALAADPKTPGTLYAGVGTNVYGSTDGGQHWSAIALGLSHTVTALLVVVQPNGKTAVFAGSGQLQRFPAAAGSSNPAFGTIVSWIFIIILFGVGYLMLRRARMQPLRGVTRAQTASSPSTEETPSSGPSAGTEPRAPERTHVDEDPARSNGHPPLPPAARSTPPARQNDSSANNGSSRPRNRHGGDKRAP